MNNESEAASSAAAVSQCAEAVLRQLNASTSAETVGTLIDSLWSAGWDDAITPDAPPELRAPAVCGCGALVRRALRELSRNEALVIVTYRHVLVVDGRHRVVVDTSPSRGKQDRRRVHGVLWLRSGSPSSGN